MCKTYSYFSVFLAEIQRIEGLYQGSGSTAADVNIPWTKKGCKQATIEKARRMPLASAARYTIPPHRHPPLRHAQCDAATAWCVPAAQAAAGTARALVCYGFSAPDTPEVGTAYTVATDARDAVFYSTCYRKEEVWMQTLPRMCPCSNTCPVSCAALQT